MPDPRNPGDTSVAVADVTALVAQALPWLGDSVREALSAFADRRKIGRVQEVLGAVTADLKEFNSEVSELYVKTPEFKQALAQTLRQAADEPNDQKRRLYRAFLTDAITSPLEPFDRQMQLLHILKELRIDHLRLLQMFTSLSTPQSSHVQSPLQMLQREFPDMPRDRMSGLLTQLTDLKIATVADWTSAAAGNAELLRNSLTSIGRKLLRYIRSTAG